MTKVVTLKEMKAEREKRLSNKQAVIAVVETALTEARELFGQGNDKASAATEKAADAAKSLYVAQIDGLVNKDEVSAILGKIFGFKAKADGTPGKTPDGAGEAIRKRIVRLVDSKTALSGGKRPSYLEGVPDEEVKPLIEAVETGKLSPYSAYDELGKLKERETVPLPVNDKQIQKIAVALMDDATLIAILETPSLRAAYREIYAKLNTVSSELMKVEPKAKPEAGAAAPSAKAA